MQEFFVFLAIVAIWLAINTWVLPFFRVNPRADDDGLMDGRSQSQITTK